MKINWILAPLIVGLIVASLLLISLKAAKQETYIKGGYSIEEAK